MSIYTDIGQVYVKVGVLIPVNSQNKQILDKYNILGFKYIDNNSIITSINLNDNFYSLILFKLNLSIDRETYNESEDSKFISYICNNNIVNTIYIKKSFILNSEVCNLLLSVIFSYNNTKINVIQVDQRSIDLTIYSIEFLNNLKNKYIFKLPDINLRQIQTVGKLKKLSCKDKLYYQINTLSNSNINNNNCLQYPYIIANIIEGSSIYLVKDKYNYKRLGGSSFGATTFWSLAQLSCNYTCPEQAINDALQGNTQDIDLSIKDIFGGIYDTFDLPEDLIASSFGKVKKIKNIKELDKKDISRSLMTLFCLCNGQIMSLLAMQENIKNIVLVGNPFTVLEFQQMIQSTVSFVSKSKVGLCFIEYSAYLNILGMIYNYEFNLK